MFYIRPVPQGDAARIRRPPRHRHDGLLQGPGRKGSRRRRDPVSNLTYLPPRVVAITPKVVAAGGVLNLKARPTLIPFLIRE